VTVPLSQVLTDMGIRQDGDPVLRQTATPFHLPAEAADAAALEARLLSYVPRLKAIYPFTKGVGIAAPQIGVSRALAIVQPPDSETHILLINPSVLWASEDIDQKAEGCLSFFDVRGEVSRPLAITVQTTDLDGHVSELRLDGGWARLALHEIDHLYGVLYSDRLAPGVPLLPTDKSDDALQSWDYSPQ
jgi:peptide deformylase